MMKAIIAGIVLSIFIGAEATGDPLPCSSPAIQRDDRISLEEMVRRADGIFWAQATGFRHEDRNDGLSGVYEFAVLSELKSLSRGPIEVPGLEPYDFLPQRYIDITEYHSEFDRQRVSIGGTSIAETEESCVIAPRFFIGYNYLIFTGLQSNSAFEPVHSPNLDMWFQAVEGEALLQFGYR